MGTPGGCAGLSREQQGLLPTLTGGPGGVTSPRWAPGTEIGFGHPAPGMRVAAFVEDLGQEEKSALPGQGMRTPLSCKRPGAGQNQFPLLFVDRAGSPHQVQDRDCALPSPHHPGTPTQGAQANRRPTPRNFPVGGSPLSGSGAGGRNAGAAVVTEEGAHSPHMVADARALGALGSSALRTLGTRSKPGALEPPPALIEPSPPPRVEPGRGRGGVSSPPYSPLAPGVVTAAGTGPLESRRGPGVASSPSTVWRAGDPSRPVGACG